jgi:hypothetical protein
MRLRLVVERLPEPEVAAAPEGALGLGYRGTVTIEREEGGIDVAVEVRLPRDGPPAASLGDDERLGPNERVAVARVVAALVRSAVARARAVGEPPPRRVARWRQVRD